MSRRGPTFAIGRESIFGWMLTRELINNDVIPGQDETSNNVIPVPGVREGDEIMSFLVFDPGVMNILLAQWRHRDRDTLEVIADGQVRVNSGALNETGHEYHLQWVVRAR